MPIYAYRCAACGHAQDVLQKISEPVLTQCPACGAQAYAKQVTAAGFQLKGSGWYVTDFRGGSKPAAKDPAKDGDGKPAEAAPAATPKAADGTGTTPAAAPAPASAAAAPPAASGGSN